MFSDWCFPRAGLTALGQRAGNSGRSHTTAWHELGFGTQAHAAMRGACHPQLQLGSSKAQHNPGSSRSVMCISSTRGDTNPWHKSVNENIFTIHPLVGLWLVQAPHPHQNHPPNTHTKTTPPHQIPNSAIVLGRGKKENPNSTSFEFEEFHGYCLFKTPTPPPHKHLTSCSSVTYSCNLTSFVPKIYYGHYSSEVYSAVNPNEEYIISFWLSSKRTPTGAQTSVSDLSNGKLPLAEVSCHLPNQVTENGKKKMSYSAQLQTYNPNNNLLIRNGLFKYLVSRNSSMV